MCIDAVLLKFIVIGEAVKQIPLEILASYPDVEWRKIAGLRDITVHSYFSIKPTILWGIIQGKLDPLSEAIEEMIALEEEKE